MKMFNFGYGGEEKKKKKIKKESGFGGSLRSSKEFRVSNQLKGAKFF